MAKAMSKPKTLVLGASSKAERYSYKAMEMLQNAGIPFLGVGNRSALVFDQEILKDIPNEKFHTVTLYLSAKNQEPYIETILQMQPNRVIFNPGTENPAFQEQLSASGISFEEACTLVLLRMGAY
jgi:predicted CoA-binding protein